MEACHSSSEVRVRVSLGLVGLAVVHAMVLAGLCLGVRVHRAQPEPAPWSVSSERVPPSVPIIAAPRPLEQPPEVNLAAQGELKQQSGLIEARPWCSPCRPTVTTRQPVVYVGPAVPVATPRPPTVDPLRTPGVPIIPTIPASSGSDAPSARPAGKQFQILLFCDGSDRSQQILQWFGVNQELQNLRTRSEFQVYRPEDPLYRTRFANVVPREQFPAIILQDASGGHIHAAGKAMIPSSSTELVADLRAAYELYRTAKQSNVATGAIRTTGYSWDDTIHPAMRLQDCGPDGCPDGWDATSSRPRPVLDRLFDRPGANPIEAIIWASAQEILTAGLVLIGLIAVVVLLTKIGPLRR